MNEDSKKTGNENEDYVFEGGTGNDKKTTKTDLDQQTKEQQAYEGLRSMIINPDEGDEEGKGDKETGKE